MVSDSGSKEKEEEMVNWMEINEAAPLKVGELAAAADRKGICCKRARERELISALTDFYLVRQCVR